MTRASETKCGLRWFYQGGDRTCVSHFDVWHLCFAAPLLLFAASVPAHAGFVASVSGDVQIISAPASSVPGALVSNDLQVWNETTGTIKSNLTLDLGGQPGNYDGLTNYTPLNTTLTAGTAYDSVMIQLDPTSPYPNSPVTASITFTNKIIGIALFGGTCAQRQRHLRLSEDDLSDRVAQLVSANARHRLHACRHTFHFVQR